MVKINKVKSDEFKWKCLNYLGGKKCYRCDNKILPICCYEFHHVNGTKDFGLSQAKSRSWSKVKIELDKCIVVCSNCHRTIHYLGEQIKV